MLLSDPSLPFVLVHAQVTMRPRSYMRVPVRFVPVAARCCDSHINLLITLLVVTSSSLSLCVELYIGTMKNPSLRKQQTVDSVAL